MSIRLHQLSQSYGSLPDHRRAIHARTHARPYRHADYDPIQNYPGTPGTLRGVLLAVAIGVGLAAALIHWWST